MILVLCFLLQCVEEKAIDEARKLLTDLDTGNIEETYEDALSAAQKRVEKLEKEIEALHETLKSKDGALSKLELEKEDYRFRAAELERGSIRRRHKSFEGVEENCADLNDITPAPAKPAPAEPEPELSVPTEPDSVLAAKIKVWGVARLVSDYS